MHDTFLSTHYDKLNLFVILREISNYGFLEKREGLERF